MSSAEAKQRTQRSERPGTPSRSPTSIHRRQILCFLSTNSQQPPCAQKFPRNHLQALAQTRSASPPATRAKAPAATPASRLNPALLEVVTAAALAVPATVVVAAADEAGAAEEVATTEEGT